MIRIVNSDFHIDDLYSSIKSNKNGAISIFVGTVRDDLFNESQIIESIFLECYEELAIKQLEEIRDLAIKKWKLNDCVIIHRVGKILLGDKIVLIITSSSHREEALRSNEFVIDQLKIKAAFWKFKEFGKDSKIIEAKKEDQKKNLKWKDIVK